MADSTDKTKTEDKKDNNTLFEQINNTLSTMNDNITKLIDNKEDKEDKEEKVENTITQEIQEGFSKLTDSIKKTLSPDSDGGEEEKQKNVTVPPIPEPTDDDEEEEEEIKETFGQKAEKFLRKVLVGD
jgi:hypothetical protein